MLPALILIGFAMITLGVALLFLGAVPFVGGKRISAWRSRLIGVVLVSFLPLALAGRQASNAYFGPDEVEGPVLTWSLFGFCWAVIFAILFRVVVPKKAAKRVSSVGKNDPFGAAEPQIELVELELIDEEAPPPAPPKGVPVKKKTPKPPVAEDNPFDFS